MIGYNWLQCFLHLTKMHLKPFNAFLDTFIFFPNDSLGGEGKIPYVFCFCTYFLKASLIPKQGKENTVASIVILKSDS